MWCINRVQMRSRTDDGRVYVSVRRAAHGAAAAIIPTIAPVAAAAAPHSAASHQRVPQGRTLPTVVAVLCRGGVAPPGDTSTTPTPAPSSQSASRSGERYYSIDGSDAGGVRYFNDTQTLLVRKELAGAPDCRTN